MLDALWWLITVEAIGLAAFPLTYAVFPGLADRGYSMARPLGMLLLGYTSWMLSLARILPSGRPSLLLLLVVLAAASALYAWPRRTAIRDFIVREHRALIAVEAVFLIVFVGWTLYRAYDPAIDHTEQPMDFAFLNASIESRYGSPEDPWLRGEAISYYYFGYWTLGAVSQMAGVPSEVAYNLSLALIPALGAAAIFGLVYAMAMWEAARRRLAMLGAAVAALMLGVVANLESVLEFMRANGMGSQRFWDWIRIDGLDGPSAQAASSWMPSDFWWWFRSTRVINTFEGGQGIDYTIEEFPFFSFMLGDLHPHVMAIPLTIVFLALLWSLLSSPVTLWSRPVPYRVAFVGLAGLVLGSLAFTNMWDLPTFGTLFIAVVALTAYADRGAFSWAALRDTAPLVLGVIGLAGLLYVPYYVDFGGSVTGIGASRTTTRPVHLFIVWGLHLSVITPFIIAMFWNAASARLAKDWTRLIAIAAAIVTLPFVTWAFLHLEDGGATGEVWDRLLDTIPLGLMVGLAIFAALTVVRRGGGEGKAFALLLAGMGLYLILGPELLFVADSFGNRMNTVFKLYYQAWILLAVASGYAIYYWRSRRDSFAPWKRMLSTAWSGVFVVLLVASLYYAPAAAASKGAFGGDASLDGLAFVAERSRAEYDAIVFIRDRVAHGSAVLEAVGEWFDAGLISRSTGVPTIINWPGHERQWRGSRDSFITREQDVARIYQTLDAAEARNLLGTYDVEYVYVGPRERAKYGADGLDKFPSFMDEVFLQADVAIYRIRR